MKIILKNVELLRGISNPQSNIQEISINTEHIEFRLGNRLFFISGNIIVVSEEDLERVKQYTDPRKRTTKDDKPKKDLLILFNELHSLTGGRGTAVFSLDRENKLNSLLTKHRFTPELLKTAAANIGRDKFLQGANDKGKRYGDIDYLLRPDKAAKWSESQIKMKTGLFK